MKKIRFGILSTAGIAQKELIPAFKQATLAGSAVGVSNEQSDFMLSNTKQKLTSLQLLFLRRMKIQKLSLNSFFKLKRNRCLSEVH